MEDHLTQSEREALEDEEYARQGKTSPRRMEQMEREREQLRGGHSPGRGESKDRGVTERGETK